MIRILHVVHMLARGGGLSNLVMNYYRHIDREKIQFDFIYFKECESDFKDEISALGGRYFKMQMPKPGQDFVKEREAFFKEHRGEYTAMHCHALFAAAMYGEVAKKYGIRHIIAHAHSAGYGKGLLRKMRNFYFVKKGVRLADYYMACSDDAASFMFGKKAMDAGKVHVISNAVDCKAYQFNEETRQAVREELGLGTALTLGHVGIFAPIKNHDFLLDVFAEICKKVPDAKLILAGGEGAATGSTMGQMKQKAKDLGLADNILFLGVRRDVPRLMMAMDAFVFPSLFEGFGLVLVEAQASGLPCLASDKVPRAAKCTDLVSYLPLESGAEVWAEHILNHRTQERKVSIASFDRYNIETQKQALEDMYLNMAK